MRLPKPIIFLIVGLLFIFVFAAIFKNSMVKVQPKVPQLTYDLRPSATELTVGQTIQIPLYLTGDSISKATAFDVKFNYDETKLKLVSATPGNFYDKYLIVKWDIKSNWFALAIMPDKPLKNPDPTKPLLTLEFKAIAKSTSALLKTHDSTVYISQTGGFNPLTGSVNFIIK
jgi:hypothetical protein